MWIYNENCDLYFCVRKVYITMDLLVDLSSLSEEIREKLAELDLELSEGKVFNIKMGNIFSSPSHYLNYTTWILRVDYVLSV